MNKTKIRLIEEVCFTEASFKSMKQFGTLVLVYGNDVKKMRSHQLKHWMWRRKTSIGRNADSLHEKVCATFKRRESFEWFIFKFSFLFFFFLTKLNIHKINKKNLRSIYSFVLKPQFYSTCHGFCSLYFCFIGSVISYKFQTLIPGFTTFI